MQLYSYSDLNFNTNGDKLASVGQDPDFMLTVWDWKSESVILRSKAFSQVIFISIPSKCFKPCSAF